MIRKRFKNFKNDIDLELKENKQSFLVFSILRAFIIFVAIRSLMRAEYESFYLCVLTIALLLLPSLIKSRFKIELPQTLEIIIYCFIFAAEILGEIDSFYTVIPIWDTLLHTINGFLSAAIGYSMVVLLNNDEKVSFNLSPLYLSLVAFCFSMTIGVLWEFSERFLDLFLNIDAQKDTIVYSINSVLLNPSGLNDVIRIQNINNVTVNGVDLGINGYLDIGLIDTMNDLFVNFIGAVLFSIYGYHYTKSNYHKQMFEQLIPTKKSKSNSPVIDSN
jgi:hypothetical protein